MRVNIKGRRKRRTLKGIRFFSDHSGIVLDEKSSSESWLRVSAKTYRALPDHPVNGKSLMKTL